MYRIIYTSLVVHNVYSTSINYNTCNICMSPTKNTYYSHRNHMINCDCDVRVKIQKDYTSQHQCSKGSKGQRVTAGLGQYVRRRADGNDRKTQTTCPAKVNTEKANVSPLLKILRKFSEQGFDSNPS